MAASRLSILKWLVVAAGTAGAATAYLLRGKPSPAPQVSTPAPGPRAKKSSPANNGADPTGSPEGDLPAAAVNDGGTSSGDSARRYENLADKIRREVLTQDRWRPYTIDIEAVEGQISLRGQLDRPDQIHEFVDLVSAVNGVERIQNFLHLPGTDPPSPEDPRKTGMHRH